MNKINYKESIDLKEVIDELVLINIDDNIEQTNDNDFINISGDIKISGEVNINGLSRDFIHTINVDISLSKEQIINDTVKVSIDDFSYNIKENFIDIDLILKIDGLKEIDTSFPTQEDNEIIEVEDSLEIDEEEIETQEIETENLTNAKEEEKTPLLSKIFKTRALKTEKAYLIHVVKEETTYEEIGQLYDLNHDVIREINNDKIIERGQLIFIPIDK